MLCHLDHKCKLIMESKGRRNCCEVHSLSWIWLLPLQRAFPPWLPHKQRDGFSINKDGFLLQFTLSTASTQLISLIGNFLYVPFLYPDHVPLFSLTLSLCYCSCFLILIFQSNLLLVFSFVSSRLLRCEVRPHTLLNAFFFPINE